MTNTKIYSTRKLIREIRRAPCCVLTRSDGVKRMFYYTAGGYTLPDDEMISFAQGMDCAIYMCNQGSDDGEPTMPTGQIVK